MPGSLPVRRIRSNEELSVSGGQLRCADGGCRAPAPGGVFDARLPEKQACGAHRAGPGLRHRHHCLSAGSGGVSGDGHRCLGGDADPSGTKSGGPVGAAAFVPVPVHAAAAAAGAGGRCDLHAGLSELPDPGAGPAADLCPGIPLAAAGRTVLLRCQHPLEAAADGRADLHG